MMMMMIHLRYVQSYCFRTRWISVFISWFSDSLRLSSVTSRLKSKKPASQIYWHYHSILRCIFDICENDRSVVGKYLSARWFHGMFVELFSLFLILFGSVISICLKEKPRAECRTTFKVGRSFEDCRKKVCSVFVTMRLSRETYKYCFKRRRCVCQKKAQTLAFVKCKRNIILTYTSRFLRNLLLLRVSNFPLSLDKPVFLYVFLSKM